MLTTSRRAYSFQVRQRGIIDEKIEKCLPSASGEEVKKRVTLALSFVLPIFQMQYYLTRMVIVIRSF